MAETSANLKQQIEEVLSMINLREQTVLELRFGLKDGRSRTLLEVGNAFRVTRERIRQIEAKALRKLRHPRCSRKLKDFVIPEDAKLLTPDEKLLRAIFGY